MLVVSLSSLVPRVSSHLAVNAEDVVVRFRALSPALARPDHHHALFEFEAVFARKLDRLGNSALGSAATTVRALSAVFGSVNLAVATGK